MNTSKSSNIILTVLFLTFSLIPQIGLNAQNTDQLFEDDIKLLFKLNGSQESYNNTFQTMFNQFRKMDTEISESDWNSIQAEMEANSLTELSDMLLPIYKRHLSHNDIKELLDFYRSPIGKKLAEKTPLMDSESMTIGVEWGRLIGEKIHNKISNKGFKIRLPFTP